MSLFAEFDVSERFPPVVPHVGERVTEAPGLGDRGLTPVGNQHPRSYQQHRRRHTRPSREPASEYATDHLGVEAADIELFVDKQSGTNPDRDGCRKLMAAIEDGAIDQVVASEVS